MAGGTVTRPGDGQVAENMHCVGKSGTRAAAGGKAWVHPANLLSRTQSLAGDLGMRPSGLNCKEEQTLF